MLSIILPVLNEEAIVEQALERLAPLRERGAEVIVVDGGSGDSTPRLAEPLADRVAAAPPGRASQMNTGAELARGDVLLFLHADTILPDAADRLIAAALGERSRAWGRFDVRIAGRNPGLRPVAAMMNWRSWLSGIATGDQAIFVRRDAFAAVGGFPPIPLMEDIAISGALKRCGRPGRIRERVTTSGRRWEENGLAKTILLMWRLRLAFYFGADPARLAARYGYGRHN
ncbi:MAG TPA: TIGR04283 family arsenosugar biosynthesis glycosyltransferase [Afifellaceae bacterium]|nr:TIGR04283 family arsenosugar biosynthesis glycosyltransferase [Afifellaceae bacterium]